MMKLVKQLMQLGMNEPEARVYIILLKKKLVTATELSKTAKINRTQMYDVLSKLIQKGMCTEVLGKVKKYSAVHPKNVIEYFEKRLEKSRETLTDLSPALFQLYKNNSEKDDPLDFVKVLRTNKNIYENVMKLVRSARESILVFNKPPYAMSPDRNEEEINSIKKGVINKCIYEFEPDDVEQFIKKLNYFSKAGEQIRIVDELPLKMIIVDSHYVVFNMQHDGLTEAQFTAMMIENSDLAKLLVKTFDVYWQEGSTLDEISAHNK